MTAYKVGQRVEVVTPASMGTGRRRWIGATITHEPCNTCATTLAGLPTARKVLAGSFCSDACELKAKPRVTPPIATRPTDPAPPADPLLCPRCSTPSHPVAMRTRGEVRSRVWRCGCVVAPEVRVEPFGVLGERLHVARGHAIEELHPTEAGAIAAWRVALEQRQREDDEAWASPTPVLAPWRLAVMGGDEAAALTGYHETQGEFEAALNAEIERVTIGAVLARTDSAPRVMPVPVEMYATREWQDRVMGALMQHRERQAAEDLMRRSMLARERAVALCDRTDDEVRHAARACTEATHPETLVAVANECARRWNVAGWERATFSVANDAGAIEARRPTAVGGYYLAGYVADVIRRIAGAA